MVYAWLVYPRVCGGNLEAGNRQVNFQRSIPACAGEPPAGVGRHRREKVYPRVCGGTRSRGSNRTVGRGLSPRVRGNLLTRDISAIRIGSIPACAGEPGASPGHLERGAVYPRVCGGTNKTNRATIPISGLSPRVRGNLPSRRRDRRPRGSIPACAGEPSSLSASSAFIRVYPRVCGGTGFIYHLSFEPVGLSPRVRGNQAQRRKAASECRSIPACAGEPPSLCGKRGAATVYPRVCGGTSVVPSPTVTVVVYPRVCGGTISSCGLVALNRGLSPRVRGNRL